MSFSLSDFSGCGFPEEYMFWCILVLFIAVFCGFILLHILVDENFIKSRPWLPVTLYIFHRNAYGKFGKVIRLIFILSTALLVVIVLMAGLLIDKGILECGVIR